MVRVTPGAQADDVGGRYGESDPPVLSVRVRARAVDGRANAAVVDVVAAAFGVAKGRVRLVGGVRSRTKTLEVDAADTEQLRELLSR